MLIPPVEIMVVLGCFAQVFSSTTSVKAVSPSAVGLGSEFDTVKQSLAVVFVAATRATAAGKPSTSWVQATRY